MVNRAVFLDRDDTIIFDPGYLSNPDLVRLLEGVGDSIYNLKNKYNFKIIVISNQSGITRGYFTENDAKKVNERINSILSSEFNTFIDDFFFCPFHPDFDTAEKIKCRKPSPQMIFQAAEKYNINLDLSYMVGDQISDIECGNKAGVKTVLLKTRLKNFERNNLESKDKTPNFVAADFFEVYNIITKDLLEQLN